MIIQPESVAGWIFLKEFALRIPLKKRSAEDAHPREKYMLHKCNRARHENAANGILIL